MKTILITGAGSGLGLELVKVFSLGGWSVIATCRDKKDFPKEFLNEKISVLSLDLSHQESLHDISLNLKSAPLDVLINCAGVFDNQTSSVDDNSVFSTIPEITKVFQVNSIAPRILADLLIPNLQKGTERLVITISSGMGTYAKMDEFHAAHWPYSASKAAVTYSMVAFAKQHPEIKSVLVSPGWMKTKMGGKDAPIEPSSSAQKIFVLISEHTTRLQSGKFVDCDGKAVEP